MPNHLPAEEHHRIHAATSFYLNHPKERAVTARVAKRAAVGEAKLRDYFHAVYNLPVQRFFQQSRLRTAQLLLRNTTQPIKAVGLRCGYANYKNFLTAYRRTFGRTPGEERRSFSFEFLVV